MAKTIAPSQIRTLGTLDILRHYGLDENARGKLVRHQDPRYPVETLLRNGWLELYQHFQRRPVFHEVDFIVSFAGVAGTRALFQGVYHVGEHRSARAGEVRADCPWSETWHREASYFYDLVRDPRFDDLRDRLVIEWGGATRSWCQNLSNKRVLELKEPGRCLPPFDDYLEFSLSHGELVELFENAEAHREWRARLSAVAGVYLILAEDTGAQYIGSATGEDGIWGRWSDYARNGHGGNQLLRKLVRSDPALYPNGFRFSILQILPKTMSRDEVIARESVYKDKLGTRSVGLNRN